MNKFGITDKLEGWGEYLFTFLFSVFIYLFVYKVGEPETLWIPFVGGLFIKYVISTTLRNLADDLAPMFNIFFELGIYLVSIFLFTQYGEYLN